MSFFNLRDCDVISTVYMTHPSYHFQMSGFQSEPVFVFHSTSVGMGRTYSDLNGNAVTGSFNLSGVVSFLTSSALSGSEKRSLNRLRNSYASGSFVKVENYTSSSVFDPAVAVASQTIHILNVPQVLYGSQIKPGSFSLKTNSGQEYTDDAFGGIFSGTLHVGCMFYQHGIAYLGSKFTTAGLEQVTASFSGAHPVPTNLYLCRVPRGELNFSENSSYTSLVTGSGTQDTQEVTTARPKTFITGVALYDEDYKLVGIAKLAQPLLNEEETALLFKLKLSF